MEPTYKQKELFRFIERYITEHKFPPTRREMMSALGFASLSSVNYHLTRLKDAGLVKLIPFVERGIVMLDKDPVKNGTTLIPLLGTVSAGSPLEVFQNQEALSVPTDMLNSRFKNYGLQVRGDSMVDEHICHDDRIIVQSQLLAKNGDTVVALIDGNSATVKTIYFESGAIRLQPANRDYQPIIVKPPQTLEIQGIVVGVLRYKQQK